MPRSRSVVVSCLVAASVFTVIDAVLALRVFGLRWLPGWALWGNAALTLMIYASFALLAALAGRGVWRIARLTRVGVPALDGILTGPVAAFGVLTALWAMAVVDASFLLDVRHLKVCRSPLVWALSLSGYGTYLAVWVFRCTVRYDLIRRYGPLVAWTTGVAAAIGLAVIWAVHSFAQPRLIRVLWSMQVSSFRTVYLMAECRRWACAVHWALCFLGCGLAGTLAGRAYVWLVEPAFQRLPRMAMATAASVLLTAGVATAALRPAPAGPHARASGNNVLLISVDALRQDYVSCYAGPLRTPNVDKLAGSGVRFTKAWSASPWTRPSCASIHLGVYPNVHGIGEKGVQGDRGRANVFPDSLSTLAGRLSAAGYQTQAFVANSELDARFGFARGFDDYCSFEDVGAKTRELSIAEAVWPPRLVRRHASRLARLDFLARPRRPVEAVRGRGRCMLAPADAFLTAAAMRWIAQARGPFFLWIHYMSVHQYGSFRVRLGPAGVVSRGRAGLRRLVSAVTLDGPIEYDPVAHGPAVPEAMVSGPAGSPVSQVASVWVAPHMIEAPMAESIDMTHYAARYQSNLAYADALIGCLLAELEARGLRGATHVVLTSDHGEEFGEHGGGWHGRTQYEEVTRVPLVIRSPSLAARGRAVAQPCSLIDVAPTILDLARLPIATSFAGQSLLPLALGKQAPARIIYSEFVDLPKDERKAIRWGDRKGISANSKHRGELYDLALDPREQHDQAEDIPYRLSELLEQLQLWEHQQRTAALEARGGGQGRATIDARMRDRLKQLGYTD